MALSPAEKQKAYRERQKKEQWFSEDGSYAHLKTPFFEHLADDANWSSVTLAFEMLGIEPPSFDDDRGPEQFAFDHCFGSDEEKAESFAAYPRSIGRADAMVGILLDAAMELSSIINRYKRDELNARLNEIRERDLSDPIERDRALKDAAEIEKMLGILNKRVRRPMPQWEVKAR